jgi:hypothetical protein
MAVNDKKMSIDYGKLFHDLPKMSISYKKMSIDYGKLFHDVPKMAINYKKMSIDYGKLFHDLPKIWQNLYFLPSGNPDDNEISLDDRLSRKGDRAFFNSRNRV